MTPMSKISQVGALKIADPTKWEATVRREMKKAEGRIPVAAQALGVSVRQLTRWLAELPDVERASPGRPWPQK